jgi:hypothetical protein
MGQPATGCPFCVSTVFNQWSVVSGQWSVVSGQWSVKMMADFDVCQELFKSLWTFLIGQSRLIAGN